MNKIAVIIPIMGARQTLAPLLKNLNSHGQDVTVFLVDDFEDENSLLHSEHAHPNTKFYPVPANANHSLIDRANLGFYNAIIHNFTFFVFCRSDILPFPDCLYELWKGEFQSPFQILTAHKVMFGMSQVKPSYLRHIERPLKYPNLNCFITCAALLGTIGGLDRHYHNINVALCDWFTRAWLSNLYTATYPTARIAIPNKTSSERMFTGAHHPKRSADDLRYFVRKWGHDPVFKSGKSLDPFFKRPFADTHTSLFLPFTHQVQF